MSHRIFYAATHSWQSPIRVGSHHLARQLTRLGKVLYSSHPISIAALLNPSENQYQQRLKLYRAGVIDVPECDGVQELTWFMPFCPGPSLLQQSALITEHGAKLCLPNPSSMLKSLGYMHPDQLWLDSFFQSFWIDKLDPNHLYVRVADHPSHITKLSKSQLNRFHQTLDRAEMIITPNMRTAEYLAALTSTEILHTENGVDLAHFSTIRSRPLEYQSDGRPNVIFVGAIASWIDVSLILETAKRCPEMNFWLIGPNHRQNLKPKPPNVHSLGSKPYAEIPAFLQHADAALAPFDVADQREFINSIDAIKLYEYLAARVPVVATKWEQSERLTPFVLTAEQKPAAFAAGLRSVLENPEAFKAPGEFLAPFDWSARLQFLPKLVESARVTVPTTPG